VTKTPTINRRGWLAVWLQDRRRARVRGALPTLLPAPLLVALYPDLAVWEWNYPDPARWNAYNSLDGGQTYRFDDWETGDARQYAPDGGENLMFIVGVDADGREITERSNAVLPEDGDMPPDAPTLVVVGDYFQGTAPVPASVWQFAQSDSPYDSGPVQDWVDGADAPYGSYDLLPPNQAVSGQVFALCTCRYRVYGVWSPWSAFI
jgi:hypothetical protein